MTREGGPGTGTMTREGGPGTGTMPREGGAHSRGPGTMTREGSAFNRLDALSSTVIAESRRTIAELRSRLVLAMSSAVRPARSLTLAPTLHSSARSVSTPSCPLLAAAHMSAVRPSLSWARRSASGFCTAYSTSCGVPLCTACISWS